MLRRGALVWISCLAISGIGCATGDTTGDPDLPYKDGGADTKGKDTGGTSPDTRPEEDTSTPDPDTGSPDTGTEPTDTAVPPDTVGGPACTTLTAADCLSSATSLGSISGDTGSPSKTLSGSDSQWARITITEDDSSLLSSKDLKVTVTLDSPSPENFDLFVYEGKAKGDGGGIECSSVSGSSTSVTTFDSVSLSWKDNRPIGGFDDTKTLSIEVRAISLTCDPSLSWSLKVEGNK